MACALTFIDFPVKYEMETAGQLTHMQNPRRTSAELAARTMGAGAMPHTTKTITKTV